MRKSEVQMTLKKVAGDGPRSAEPTSIPPKRTKVNLDQVVTDMGGPACPSPTPPVFIRKMRNAAVGTGCDIRLKVAVAGDPQPSLYWYRNDLLLDTSNQEYGGLWIRDCKPSDAGLYTCVANNRLGESRSSAVLAVLDLGEDSETTEDETAEPQVPMETKDGPRGPKGQAVCGVPPGDGDRITDITPDTKGGRGLRMDRWTASQNTVVEKEVLALGSKAPGPQDFTKPTRSQSEDVLREALPQVLPNPSPKISQVSIISPIPSRSGSAPTTPLTPRKKVVVPTHYQDTVSGEFEEKIKQPKSSGRSQSSTQDSRPQTPISEGSRKDRQSPIPTRSSAKILEKVRAFEERRRSFDHPEGSISGRSWAGFNRASSIDSDDGGSCLGFSRESSKEDLRDVLKADADQRRSRFKQRAASLEDRPSYSQKVQDIENKFTEELQRIKKLVGKSHLRKSFSTEQLSHRGRQPLRKLEPIPPQVIRKLQDREHVQRKEEQEEREQPKEQTSQKLTDIQIEQPHKEPPQLQQVNTKKPSVSSVTVSRLGEETITPEAMTVPELTRQRSPRQSRKSSPTNVTPQTQTEAPRIAENQSSSYHPPREEWLPNRDELLMEKVDQRYASPLEPREFSNVQEPPRPPRPPSSPSPIPSPVLEEKQRETEVTPVFPAPNLAIPTIIVEEPIRENVPTLGDRTKTSTNEKERRTHRTRGKAHRTRPMSPEMDSSDDSYVSAEEDPLEAPVFECPLQDTVASAGMEVQLKCIVVGTPLPEVTWKKDGVEIKSSSTHTVKVEGERHSLLIKQTKPDDSGTYYVTAVNEVDKASCNATLFIKSEPAQEQRGNLSVPMDISSPITSDEEYLSPLEESMDSGPTFYRVPEPRRIVDARFREPPSFQVTLNDQAVIEGQEVTMSVRMHGQPKPMIYWLRDRVTIKTDNRHVVRETKDGSFEMKIISAQRSDAGVYTCKIINEYGTKQCESKLDVKAPPAEPLLVITRQLKDVTVKAGETAMFECHMTGAQDTDVDWLSNGKLIQPALLDCKMHFDGRKCRLLLNSVHEDDSGVYTCKLSTAKEELTSSAKLKVIPSIEPLFTRKLEVLEVIEGRTARFDCKVSGTPPPGVTWSHFDHPLADGENVRILKEGGRHSLVIAHVGSENEGFFTAVARNVHGKAESSAELYVQEHRPVAVSQMAKLEKMPSIPEEPEVPESEVERFTMPDFVKPLFDLDVVEGKEAVLKCKVAGLPYPTITWFHKGQRIDSTDDRKMMQYRDIHSLFFRSVLRAHAGVYKGVISNKVGKAACYAHLYVTDVLPDPPDGPPVVEAITGKTISLRWKRPKRLDPSIDSSSLMYSVQQQAFGSNQWTMVAADLKQTSYTVTSLSKGIRYSFRVLSVTNKAFSKPSPPTDPVQLLDRGPYLHKAPAIIDKPDVVYMAENQPVSITITLNHVHATVTWTRGGKALANKPGMFEMSMPDDDQHALKIVQVKSSDVGPLTCTASNQFGSDSCILTLEMAEPPTFESIMEDMDVHVGETPQFAVVVEGKPIPDIMWYKNDTLLSESSHFTFVYDDNECSLVVLNTREEDSGVYTCTAKNLAGSVSCKAELTVHSAKREEEEPMEDEETILRKMRRLTDYYDVHKEIGRGAFSYVKRVTQKVGKVEYAAKFISARAKRMGSALREMKLLSQLDHERIVYFHDAFEKKNVVVIITELCHEELLERLTKKTTVMESEIRSSVRQLLEGVSFLHQKKILHLDIKPENILMAEPNGDQIRICDFGNAMELTPDEAQYCKYGTPEFVAPEIVNQTPVSKATDIWPIGVITYLCLTGVSPFAGENDRSSVLNIRNYNVAFEESMFAGLCREAKGFVIKLLVADRLRPDTNECLRHPWFKTLTKGKSISTEGLKQFLSRRKWQRSLISYKSKMVMRSIPELMDDSSSHISIAVPRHLKECSPPPSSSSDSDEDIDELPFIPMPLTMEFSGSRMSLNEIPGDEEVTGRSNGSIEGGVSVECDPAGKGKEKGESAGRGRTRRRTTQEEDKGSSDEEPEEMAARLDQSKRPLRRGSSVESDKAEGSRRRGELRRGSSADSALLLYITPEEGTKEEVTEEGKKILKKAVSMELPRRSPSPGAGKLSQEDYALKLELMRQRLLRGGSVDNKMSGLRGPLLETLGMGEEKRTSSLERYPRTARLGAPPLTRAASSDSPREEALNTKVLRKSASFTHGDPETIPLHRRSGAPLEIPLAHIEERRLQEATSMSALSEPAKVESRPVTPRKISLKPLNPEPGGEEQVITAREEEMIQEIESRKEGGFDGSLSEEGAILESATKAGFLENKLSMLEEVEKDEMVAESMPISAMAPRILVEENSEEEKREEEDDKNKGSVLDTKEQESPEINISISSVKVTPFKVPPEVTSSIISTPATPPPPSQVTLPDGRRSAYASIMQTIMVPSLQPVSTPAPTVIPSRTPSSELVPTPALPKLEPPVTIEHPAVFSRVASSDKRVKSPSPTETPIRPSPPREPTPSLNIKDIASEEVFEARFKKRESSLTRGFKFLAKTKSEEKKPATPSPVPGEEVYRPGPIGAPLEFIKSEASGRLLERSRSVQDLREVEKDSGFMRRLSLRLRRAPSADRKDERPAEEGPVPEPASRRRVSWSLGRSRSQEKKDVEMIRLDGGPEAPQDKGARETKKANESPVMAIRRKIGSKVAGISMRIRSQSEDRKSEEKETKPEKRTPLLSLLRRSNSEGVNLKRMDIPQNQLAAQSGSAASTESLESTTSIRSETAGKNPETDRRSRWDRWGLTRGKKDKTASQPDIPSAISRENGSLHSHQYTRLASDFPPVFHIKLRDHVLLEGDPVTLSCLPAGSPPPHIAWSKDKRPLDIDARMNMVSCPDGRQVLMIMKTTKKDAGLYECVATNPLGYVSSSCTISLARLPNCPGTPEVPQKYKNTALVLWRPSDTLTPCTYSLERKREGEANWLIVATGVADCFYNVTDLPEGGTFRFRVACVNKAGQGPYSNCSEKVCLDPTATSKGPAVVIVKTLPSTPAPAVSALEGIPPFKPGKTVSPTLPSPAVAEVHKPSPSQGPALSPSKAVAPTAPMPTQPASVQSPSRTPLPTVVPRPPSAVHSVLSHRANTEVQASTSVAPLPAKAKTTLNITVTAPASATPSAQSLPKAKPTAPTVLPKPQSPVNVVPPLSQTATASPTPTAIGKPVSSVPTYVPVTTMQASVPPLSPPVVLVTSLTPIGESVSPPPRTTPDGRATPSAQPGKPGETALRQGVPQKPYTFMDEKARGRFGVIRECRENATGNLFMAKIVPYDSESKQGVLQEYDVLKSLHHDKIMALHEAYVTPRYLVLISEYCAGKELLYSLVDRFRYSEDDVVSYLVQILQGLEYLHNRRILHLDIKPDNILITHFNTVKIIDFGSAQNFNPLILKNCSRHLGTLEFMSPEMLKGDVVGPPADIWSVGVLTYITLSGRLPFLEADPLETETKILAAKFDHTKLYPNVSQTASLFLKKILCSYTWARPTIKDCFNNSWLQDAYLMKLRRQTLTFNTTRLKEFLVEYQRRRSEALTKHKVLLRSYSQSTPTTPTTPSAPVTK